VSKLFWLRLGVPIAGRMPRLFYALAWVVGWALWHLRPGLRRNAIRNMLPLCDGDLQRARRESVRAFRNASRYHVDFATIPRRDMANFERDHIQLVHGERLEALSRPGPLIILSAHVGNPELVVQALTFRGRPFTALVEALKPDELADFVIRVRSAQGGRFLKSGIAGVRACAETLAAGGLVGMIGDRDIQGTGICVTLCGRRVKLPRGPWELARRSGAPVLPIFCSRGATDRMQVFVEEPICVPTAASDEAIDCAVQRWAALLERQLRREPGQWTVLEDFWKVHACGSR
jgi:KDO2-lipid IV(A) lauroyltransferase